MPELLQEHFGRDGDWAEKSERVVNASKKGLEITELVRTEALGGCLPEPWGCLCSNSSPRGSE